MKDFSIHFNSNSRIPYGRIKPLGYLKDFMEGNLKDGYIGHLDELLPYNIGSDDIYGKDRRSTAVTDMDLGLRQFDANLTGEYMWWNAEGQGNWMDGFIRTAFLCDVPEMKEKARKWVQHYLDTVDDDGYFGIYRPDSRFRQGKESGELWAQSTMLRCFSAWYEYTGDEKVFSVIKNACDMIMKGYPLGQSRPFSCADEPEGTSCGGLSHGLTITDTFYFLYMYTGERKYIDYAVWLYKSASEEPKLHSDISYRNMLEESYRLKSHGVHSYEHIRALAIAKYFGSDDVYSKAFDGCLRKVFPCITPTGGPTGNEFVSGHYADATKYGYEYCTIHELFHSWSFLYELSGDFAYLDRAEKLFWNAAFGAHHPTSSAVTYLKTDNCYRLLSAFDPRDIGAPEYIHYGYKYSPTHQDMAVCCVPNAGRLFPYYVSASWQKTEEGFLRTLYTPSVLEEEFHGVKVKIEEEGSFPYSGSMSFRVQTEKPVTFRLSFRIPSWCESFSVSVPYEKNGSVIEINSEWHDEKIDITFDYAVRENKDNLGDSYISWGPLVYALPIKARKIIAGSHTLAAFHDLEYAPLDEDFRNLSLISGSASFDTDKVTARFKDTSTGEESERELVPVGKTILRRVTFPEA